MTPTPPMLDPFALPAETDGRFRMMIVAALIVAWSLGTWLVPGPHLADVVFGGLSPELRGFISRQIEAGRRSDRIVFSRQAVIELGGHVPELASLGPHLQRYDARIFVSLVACALLVIATLGLYLLFPRYLLLRHRAIPIEERTSPRLVRELRALAARAGLRRTPRFWVAPGMLDGLAFGAFRSQGLLLTGETALLERSWSDLHRAVTLHEVGHLANRDVVHREVVRASWLALAGLVCGSVMLVSWARSPGFEEMLGLTWRISAMVLLTWALWGGLVRARELYADWRVVTWGYGDALARRLSLPFVHGGDLDENRWGRAWKWLRGLFGRMHPSNEERLRALGSPRRLFAVTPELAGATGLLVGLLGGAVGPFLLDVFVVFQVLLAILIAKVEVPLGFSFLFVLQVILILVGLLIAGRWVSGALGIQIQRAAVFDLFQLRSGWGYLRLAPIAGLFVLGLEAGLLATQASFFAWRDPAALLLWLGGFSLLVWTWLVQIRAMSRLILGAWRSASLRWISRFLGWVAALQLAAILLPALTGRLALYLATAPSLVELLQPDSSSSMNLLAFARMSAFMFLAGGFALEATIGLLVLAVTGVWLRCRRVDCGACSERAPGWRLLGMSCEGCGEPLAAWVRGSRPPLLLRGGDG